MSSHQPPLISLDSAPTQLTFAGIRIIEFSHMVMGAICGMVLADLEPALLYFVKKL